jgi:hypothetical protein
VKAIQVVEVIIVSANISIRKCTGYRPDWEAAVTLIDGADVPASGVFARFSGLPAGLGLVCVAVAMAPTVCGAFDGRLRMLCHAIGRTPGLRTTTSPVRVAWHANRIEPADSGKLRSSMSIPRSSTDPIGPRLAWPATTFT